MSENTSFFKLKKHSLLLSNSFNFEFLQNPIELIFSVFERLFKKSRIFLHDLIDLLWFVQLFQVITRYLRRSRDPPSNLLRTEDTSHVIYENIWCTIDV